MVSFVVSGLMPCLVQSLRHCWAFVLSSSFMASVTMMVGIFRSPAMSWMAWLTHISVTTP